MQIQITGIHMEVDEPLRDYVNKKIGKLERYVSPSQRNSTTVDIKLKAVAGKGKPQQACEAILTLPKETIIVEETTLNAYAAIDIVETALKTHLRKYKQLHGRSRFYHRLRSRWQREDLS